MEFDWTCDGIDLARGKTFQIALPKIEKGWQNLEVTAHVKNRRWQTEGIIAKKRLQTHYRAKTMSGKDVEWTVVDPESEFKCKQGEEDCKPTRLVLLQGLPYADFIFNLEPVPLSASPHTNAPVVCPQVYGDGDRIHASRGRGGPRRRLHRRNHHHDAPRDGVPTSPPGWEMRGPPEIVGVLPS
eukprot:7386589-Prymnesium_polylepis.1